jgi:predicted DNA-binding ribbon-helix-helix protein
LVAGIDETRQRNNRSSALRVFILEHFRNRNGRTPTAP